LPTQLKIDMKYSAVFFFVVLLACGSNRDRLMSNLLNEQRALKDSANNITDRIGGYMEKGLNENAEAQKKQLAAVHARLIHIQSSIDSLEKMK